MRRLAAGVAWIAASACAVPQSPPTTPADHRAGGGRWGDRVSAELVALPAVFLEVDDDPPTDPAGRPGRATGPGVGARLSVGNRDQSVGLLYHGAWLEEDRDRTDLTAQALYLDFDVEIPVDAELPAVLAHAGGGFGVARLAFDDPRWRDVTTGALELRLDLLLRASRHFAVSAGIGGFVWGNPGDTEAFGTFLGVDARLSF